MGSVIALFMTDYAWESHEGKQGVWVVKWCHDLKIAYGEEWTNLLVGEKPPAQDVVMGSVIALFMTDYAWESGEGKQGVCVGKWRHDLKIAYGVKWTKDHWRFGPYTPIFLIPRTLLLSLWCGTCSISAIGESNGQSQLAKYFQNSYVRRVERGGGLKFHNNKKCFKKWFLHVFLIYLIGMVISIE